MKTTQNNCEVGNCPLTADYAYYPNHQRKQELAVFLCEEHRGQMILLQTPKVPLYKTATLFVTNSLV